MRPIDPSPTGKPPKVSEPNWYEPRKLEIPGIVCQPRDFADLLRSRRSTRHMQVAALSRVASVVRETLKSDFIGTGSHMGRKLKRVISAGALHPIKSVIIDSDGYAVAYDDDHDAFLAIKPRKLDLLAKGLRSCATVLPSAHGHFIALMADVHLTSTVYKNPESLLWRDAGAVLQTLAMASEAFDLGFCPLGILGQDFADALLPEDHQYLGVGVAVIGQRAPE
ncbi:MULTISPECIES: hypothetical protein [Agrobacterium]|uniref:Nitroreductase domain-containing protein n=1 Tax=Agrobacterium tumefaciens TaxID=358 RepID=A0AAE6EDG4_AGRTU|nr:MULTISPECIES: hypothetical protein [Agrobacterium]QCL72252.1 hypothetical protein CFBP5499_01570 [Agrobacterium tumefaciens]QCL77823.1 hypothetical protein CFBP5877_01120 [Agrobacterium tumefaciens]